MSTNVSKAQLVQCYQRLNDVTKLSYELVEIEELDRRLRKIEKQLPQLAVNYNKILHQLEEFLKLKEKILQMNQELDHLSQATEDYERSRSSVLEAQRLKIAALEQADLQKGMLLKSLKAECEATMEEPKNGILTWKIDNIVEKIRIANIRKGPNLDSPVFRTANTGYRMRVSLFLSSGDIDDEGKGSHISVYFKLMNGTYNRLLDWPFKQKVTFTLICPDNRDLNISESFIPDPEKSQCFDFTETENVGVGILKFAPVSVLEGDTFIKHDTMFFRCVVDDNHYKP